jgi:hypothetical protein
LVVNICGNTADAKAPPVFAYETARQYYSPTNKTGQIEGGTFGPTMNLIKKYSGSIAYLYSTTSILYLLFSIIL